MSEHDPMCFRYLEKFPDVDFLGNPYPCHCDLIARVRADERNRWGLGWVAAADNVQALAHAEAVAARLVEVICEMHGSPAHQLVLRGLDAMYADLCTERDAARAELAEVRERIAKEIEAFHAEQCGGPESPWSHICTCSYAARIARGGTQ